MFQPTFNICGLSSGYGGEGTKTVLPCKSRVKIDMRLVKNQDPTAIFNKFKRHMETHGFGDLELKLLTAYKPAKTPIDHPMSRAVVPAVADAFDAAPILYPLTGGSNPSSVICDFLKIPMIKVPYGSHDEANHAPNENLVVDLFFKGIKCTATVLHRLADA
jgi:acetylornithine deacetylase/succinyl-diaminopimelate desuccinylase-like protein